MCRNWTTIRFNTKEQAITPAVSMREASRRLKQHPRYLKGLADGLGIKLEPIGGALALNEEDLEKLRKEAEKHQTVVSSS